jgi:hypothetical protein
MSSGVEMTHEKLTETMFQEKLFFLWGQTIVDILVHNIWVDLQMIKKMKIM